MLMLFKRYFFVSKVIFLGYKMCKDSLSPELTTPQVVREWPTPTSLFQIRSFHGLTSFYLRFIQNFNSIMAPIIDLIKKGEFR